MWGRVRRHLLTIWEAGLSDSGAFNTGPGQRVTDTLWRSAVRREYSASCKQGPGAWALLLWDLAKAFEYVDHTELIRRARAEIFPAYVLRLVLMAYKWERTIILSGMAAEGLYPTRGIAAGDFAATYLLKA